MAASVTRYLEEDAAGRQLDGEDVVRQRDGEQRYQAGGHGGDQGDAPCWPGRVLCGMPVAMVTTPHLTVRSVPPRAAGTYVATGMDLRLALAWLPDGKCQVKVHVGPFTRLRLYRAGGRG